MAQSKTLSCMILTNKLNNQLKLAKTENLHSYHINLTHNYPGLYQNSFFFFIHKIKLPAENAENPKLVFEFPLSDPRIQIPDINPRHSRKTTAHLK